LAGGLIVDALFKLAGLEPTGARHAKVTDAGVSWNYTTVLNIIFLALAAVLVARSFRKGGGLAMLRMMTTLRVSTTQVRMPPWQRSHSTEQPFFPGTGLD
jgi:hypothetical protein